MKLPQKSQDLWQNAECQFFNGNSRPRPGLVVVYFIGSGFNGRSQTLLQAAIICGTLCRLARLERSNTVRYLSVLKVELQIFSSAAFFLHGQIWQIIYTHIILSIYTAKCMHTQRERERERGM